MTASLDALRKLLERPEAIRNVIAESLAEECINLVKDGFRSETDPYGRKWAPKKKPDGRKVLSGPTNRLKGGWHRKVVTADEVIISPAVDYALHHQVADSESRLPRRMMVPDDALGMPPEWEKTLNEASTDAFAVIFGGDGRRVAGLRQKLGVKGLVGFKVG